MTICAWVGEDDEDFPWPHNIAAFLEADYNKGNDDEAYNDKVEDLGRLLDKICHSISMQESVKKLFRDNNYT